MPSRAPVAVKPQEDIYAETVRALRQISRDHAAATSKLVCFEVEPDEGRLCAAAQTVEWLEDAALHALCPLTREASPEHSFRAINAAGAGWLRAVILNRATETALTPSG